MNRIPRPSVHDPRHIFQFTTRRISAISNLAFTTSTSTANVNSTRYPGLPRQRLRQKIRPPRTLRTMSTTNDNISSDAKKLIPADPCSSQVIRKVTPNITTVSAPFARFGMFKVGSRATIVKLANDSLAVFSPSSLTPAVRTAAEELGGNVQYLVAPDFEHHIFLTQWSKAYPSAKVIGVEGLPEKRASDPEAKDTKFTTVFTAKERRPSIDAAFDGEFDVEYVPAHGNKELVFNHRPSRTLIQADLIFNLPAYEQYSKTKPRGSADATSGLATRIWNAIMNTKGDNKLHKRFVYYAIVQDKKDFSESMQRIHAWDWDRMIPCHGEVVETGAKSVFENVMSWYLTAKQA